MSIISVAEVKALVSSLNDAAYTTPISTQIPLIEEFIGEYCNNFFTKYEQGYRDDFTYTDARDLTFANSGSTITDNNDEIDFSTVHDFAVGDNIYIKGTRKNDGFYDIKTITDTIITVGDLYSLVNETSSENYLIWIFLVDWPKALKMTAAQMIEYDILRKYNTDKSITSEKIGDYAVTFDKDSQGMAYPKQIMDDLNNYRNVGVK